MSNTSNQNKKVLMALSGGIDSAVSAYKLIQAGYQVEAAFMKNWSSQAGLKYDECPWLEDRQDALRVAAFLGIPMHTLNFEREYEQKVLEYFFAEYQAGRTPNPDVMCNKEIKFKMLYNWAIKKQGFDYLATGHYAQVEQNNDQFFLKKAKDEFKDQTYFIYNILSNQLPHILFPIGNIEKLAVKKLAQKIGLPNADKKESMGLCFVGKIRLKDFLDQKLNTKTGSIVDMHGEQIGTHEGLAYYTIGQRHGIKVGEGGPWFVVKKDMETNQLVVTNDPDDPALEVTQIEIHSVNWITRPDSFPAKLLGRYRHQGDLEKLTIEQKEQGTYTVTFEKPQKALASGQSLVLYDKKYCLGGGVIA